MSIPLSLVGKNLDLKAPRFCKEDSILLLPRPRVVLPTRFCLLARELFFLMLSEDSLQEVLFSLCIFNKLIEFILEHSHHGLEIVSFENKDLSFLQGDNGVLPLIISGLYLM